MGRILLKTPAKVNLYLEVLGKREDGYHEIVTVMQSIDLIDEILLEEREEGIKVSCQKKDLPRGRDNLAYRAAELLLREMEIKKGVEIKIRKRIPLSGGLGGGSSDASATLLGLNELWKLKLSNEELMNLGAKLGADVPFFMVRGTVLATGRGDRLKILPPFKGVWLILVNDGLPVSTAWVYENLKLKLTKGARDIKILLDALERRDLVTVGKNLYNALETVTIKKYPSIGLIKDKLLSLGALGALMTGSGSTVFGLTSSRRDALTIYKAIKGLYKMVRLCRTI